MKESMEQSSGPPKVDEPLQRHRNLNLPPCYGFHPSDEQLLELFLRKFTEGKEMTACPIHNITDVYSSPPEVLTGAYEHGGYNEWFFFATKKYDNVTSRAERVIDDGEGRWVRKGLHKQIFANDRFVGTKRTQDFYGQGVNRAYWRMEEFSLAEKSNHVLAKIYAIPEKQKSKSRSGTESTPPAKKLKQHHPVDDVTPQLPQNKNDESLPAQQTQTDHSPTADDDLIYTSERERSEWMKDTFLK